MAEANFVDLSWYAGLNTANFSGSQYVETSSEAPGLTNFYDNDGSNVTTPMVGASVAYVWENLAGNPLNLSLGLGAYDMDLTPAKIQGVETQAVNLGNTGTLNYSLLASSYAFMLEPKLIYARYRLQPYFLGGIGAAVDTLSNYTETGNPAQGTSPMNNMFNDQTSTHLALEFGAGLQYVLHQDQKSALTLGVEYRYFDLGNASLGTFNGQTTTGHLSEDLQSSVFDARIGFQF